jgi:hypothetical protein
MHLPAYQKAGRACGRPAKAIGGNVTRPRAADDFATIHARLAELRRERELAAKQDALEDEDRRDGAKLPRGTDARNRGDKGELPGLGTGRRYLPVRQR